MQRLTKSRDTDEARLQQLEEQLQRHQTEAAAYLKSLQQYQERFDAVRRTTIRIPRSYLSLCRLSALTHVHAHSIGFSFSAHKCPQLSRAIEKTAEQRDAVQQEYAAMQAQLEKFEKEQAKFDDELSGIEEKLRNARDDRRVNREQEAMNEAIDAMKRLFPVSHAHLLSACCRHLCLEHAHSRANHTI